MLRLVQTLVQTPVPRPVPQPVAELAFESADFVDYGAEPDDGGAIEADEWAGSVKATDGGDHLAPMFKKNWKRSNDAGLKRGAYHFFYWCRTAGEQADWFIRNVPREANLLPPVLDVEWNGASRTCTYRPSKVTAVAELQRFMDRIEAHYGKRPIIYTAVDFHRDVLVGQFKDYHFWLRAVADHPSKVYEDRRWAFWQYTSTGVIPGVDGEVDINVFAGSQKNWKNWVAAVSAN